MKNVLISLLLIAAVVVYPHVVTAHGEGGIELTKEADGMVADLDYNENFIQANGDAGRFTFDLYTDDSRTERVPFTDLWVRISHAPEENNIGKMIFAGPVDLPVFGKAGISFAFFEPGPYVVYVRYMNDKEKVTEVEFPVDVFSLETEKPSLLSKEFAMGSLAGALVTLGVVIIILGALRWFRKKPNSALGI